MSDRRIILLRHGMSPLAGTTDHGRSLSDDGRREAESIGRQLQTLSWIPDLALVSDATRTRQTWERVLEASAIPVSDVVFLSDLYQASTERILSVLEDLEGHRQTALLLGHNPGISRTASWMSGIRIGMGTANAALLHHSAPMDWASVSGSANGWKLVEFLRPVKT